MSDKTGATVSAGAADTAAATSTAKDVQVTEPVSTPTKAHGSGDKAESSGKKAENEDDVDDLDDLLDDFADDVLAKPPGSTVDGESKGGATNTTGATTAKPDEFDGGISELINDMKIDDPETQKQFAELVKQFETSHRADVEAAESNPNNFEYVMKETMERLKKSGSKIDEQAKSGAFGGGGSPEDMILQLLSGMGGDDMDVSKLLVDMLEQLSSKEVLYEPIKDLNTKFPAYLEENKDKLNQDKLHNYNQQYEMTAEILKVFDAPDYNDDDKQKREKVNLLLEKLQSLGQPPSELVGDLQDFPGFGGGAGAGSGLDFNNGDLPKDIEKELAEGCKQQ